ncbi:MAG: beta-lactamase [Massilia sp.]|jgi:CubicO group peptidase (beta-lactamase class C family)|nr:beta-lactamase [Massilia sp.]
MAITTAWHGRTFDEHLKLRDDAAKNGFRFLSLSLHGTSASPHYSAVMIKRPVVVAQRDWPLLTGAEFQKLFDEQAKQGFGPVILSATGSVADPRFAVVFQMQSPIALTRFGLRSGADTDLESIQGMNKKAKADNLILVSAALYGDVANPRFSAVWLPNPGKTVWNADGVNETAAQYQDRFSAEAAGWCRPALVATNGGHYFSTFMHNEIGPWVARHGMSAANYQSEFDTWTAKGYFPLSVQGGGSGADTRYTALFAKQETPLPQQFTAVGPSVNATIDNVVFAAMRDSPVWNASLAIVHGKRLVYARAYSYGEPDWPVCQPTSRFRIASVSKMVTAMAVYQLIGEGKLALTDKLQDILQLKTPSGGAPKDPDFKSVTIKHLLEHTSGINANAFRDEIAILDAHKAAQPVGAWHLPVSAEMCDAYIASLDMPTVPNMSLVYNNCAYYLLGRVVAKKRARAKPIDAFQDFLFDPLFIHRIRRAPSLIAATPQDEARYRSQDIPVLPSVMSDARPLVPLGYGTEHFERQEGGGGLSAAATDLARLIAVLQSPDDTPAMKRSTVEMMMNNGVATLKTWNGNTSDLRAGHGWDGAASLGNHKFYGQKGGSLNTTGNVLEFNGEWGFAMCWGGRPGAAAGWYPDYPDVMDVAKQALANAADLFPQYGMPSL